MARVCSGAEMECLPTHWPDQFGNAIFELMHTILFLLVSLMLAVSGFSQEQSLTVATLNCYWFFNGEEGKSDIDKPRSSLEYSTKAGHLIGLLPKEAPLF